jgi:hypothetical protein
MQYGFLLSDYPWTSGFASSQAFYDGFACLANLYAKGKIYSDLFVVHCRRLT